jgi:hypothetical protein
MISAAFSNWLLVKLLDMAVRLRKGKMEDNRDQASPN